MIDADRFGASTHLAADEIEARPAWKPMHLQTAFRSAACRGGAVAEEIFAKGLCLPSGSNLSDSDLERVIARVLSSRADRRGRS